MFPFNKMGISVKILLLVRDGEG